MTEGGTNMAEQTTLTSFDDCFAELISDRFGNAITVAMQTDAEYKRYWDDYNHFHSQVKQLLGPENFKLLMRLDDANCLRIIYETRIAYEQGMRDGLRLNRIVGGIA